MPAQSPRQVERRRALRWLAAGFAAPGALLGCGGGEAGGEASAAPAAASKNGLASIRTASLCADVPKEAAGPYPGDGSNGDGSTLINALALPGIVRSDIRSSIAGATGVASGVPLTVTLQLVNTRSGCASLSGHAIYLWHCTQDGRYSMYADGLTGENFLRGVQETDADGTASFITVFPGCYAGRMPHLHVEVYPSVASATGAMGRMLATQIALPNDACSTVYAMASGYGDSGAHFMRMGYATDPVFNDGIGLQLADMAGSLASGYAATLQLGIAA